MLDMTWTAGANPEFEKPDSLLLQRSGDLIKTQRRPADIHLPPWTNGSPSALDFAITAAQQSDNIDLAARERLAATQTYKSLFFHMGLQAVVPLQHLSAASASSFRNGNIYCWKKWVLTS